MRNVLAQACGHTGTIDLHDDRIVIRRSKLMSTMSGFPVERELLIYDIASTQLKPAGLLTNGYLQFTAYRVNEKPAPVSAVGDAFAVMFTSTQQPAFVALKRDVDARAAGVVRAHLHTVGDVLPDAVAQKIADRMTSQPPPHHAPLPYAPPQTGAPGTPVCVLGSDGMRYPGIALQLVNGHYLCSFPNGQTQWVPASAVTS